MAGNGIAPQVEELIRRCVRSVEQLEVLLLLFRSPEKHWNVEAVYNEIKSSPASVRQRLDELTEMGLLEKTLPETPLYQFKPLQNELQEAVALLATEYRERPVRIIQLIYTEPDRSLKEFSDAFKLRKKVE